MTLSRAIDQAGGFSPYMRESLALHPGLIDGLDSTKYAEVLHGLFDEQAELVSLSDEMRNLRILKRKLHLVIALADISGDWSWVETTEWLTRLADFAMSRLLKIVAREQGIAGSNPDNPIPGLFVVAMGKYGARELNYSSDIDFCVFYDPDRLDLPRPSHAERMLIRIVQNLIKGFKHVTEHGYVFRTDLRLRPDPRSTAVAVSVISAERYYQTLGQNWERAAMIKARICSGDKKAGDQFKSTILEPFIWRHNLDQAAIEDILALKRQIHAGSGKAKPDLSGFNVKLGRGGIREIEFYAQTQQLILGGRQATLRTPRTVDALRVLAHNGFIDPGDASVLIRHYGELRRIEHRLQIIRDEQTHSLPASTDDMNDLARFLDYMSASVFQTALREILKDVQQRFNALFPDVESLSSRKGTLLFTGVEPHPETLRTLRKMGFSDPDKIWSTVSRWLGGRIAATRTARARELLTNLAPVLLGMCSELNSPDKAFYAFERFFTSISVSVYILSMFSQQQQHLRFILSLMEKSPDIADQISREPGTLNALAEQDFFDVNTQNLVSTLARDVADHAVFEDALDVARQYVHEDRLRIGASLISGAVKLEEADVLYSHVAEQTVAALLPAAVSEVERLTGPLNGEVGVIALGKLGSREMNATSDLDVMLVYDSAQKDGVDHRRYAKVAQHFISALSSHTSQGGLYEVDMALRPSGRSGPVAVSLEMLESYYRDKAWTWEFMALTRARVVAASHAQYQKKLSGSLTNCLTAPRPDLDFKTDVRDMHVRLRREKLPRHPWDIKNLQGGLRDVEFIAQSFALEDRDFFAGASAQRTGDMLDFVSSRGFLNVDNHGILMAALAFYHNFAQAIALIAGKRSEKFNAAICRSVSDLCGMRSVDHLEEELHTHLEKVRQCVENTIYAA
ncbi:MAG: bifunctional [glutamine synthetase] adenylyltransferase/[glutamine synthetase]-adenylyl-L-tyrosine phosphorylase [Hyphomonadaceae bacterium]|nr:bifunctional [glutamine synthetase] adenylyltransferase/[glutamine synthetase]-adenylyl-L-tyrosine phosphorylase [Hyphomonadaceae bacterium]